MDREPSISGLAPLPAFGVAVAAANVRPRSIFLARSDPRLRPAKIAVAIGFGLLVVSTIGMVRGVEPFATWYYFFAWYSLLLAVDGALALRGGGNGIKGEFLLLGRPRHLVSLLGWSTVVWLFYELLNFRLQNWYYIFLPESALARWVSSAIAFATVLPAVFVAEAMLHSFRFAEGVRWKPVTVTPRLLDRMQKVGAVMMVLVLVFPRYFFPLVWGASMLMVEPNVYRRTREGSLLADLERGRPGRLLRLLAGGALIGLLWELLNTGARMKWIYTVPFFEDTKLFEMPVPGFLGFPPFAVECFILWQALVGAGLAVPRIGEWVPASRLRRAGTVIGAVAFSLLVLLGMERFTFTSLTPDLAALPGVPAARLGAAGYDVFRLANTDATLVAADLGGDRSVAEQWVNTARLATLRGIGTDQLHLLNRVGIHTVGQLAETRPARLTQQLENLTGQTWVAARIRVWVRGAQASEP